jgi:hypothetical protein
MNNQMLLFSFFQQQNGWGMMEFMGFNGGKLDKMRTRAMYNCPFDKNCTFYGVSPIAIMSDNVYKYRTKEFARGSFNEMAWDLEWTRQFGFNKEGILDLGGITSSFLGHGYTDGTLPSDGSGSIELVKVPINNGDWLVCWAWKWYNK